MQVVQKFIHVNLAQLKKLEMERAHRLHAFFGEWFDITDANHPIRSALFFLISSFCLFDFVSSQEAK